MCFGRSPSMRLRIAQMRAVSDNNLCRQASPGNKCNILSSEKSKKKILMDENFYKVLNTALNRLDIIFHSLPRAGKQFESC